MTEAQDVNRFLRAKVVHIVESARSMGKAPDLSSVCLDWVNLSGLDLRGASFRNGLLRGADLSEANLRGADLSGADLRDSRLVEADLSQAHLDGARLRGTCADRVILEGVDLSGVDLSWVGLSGVILLSPQPSQSESLDTDIPSWKDSEVIEPDIPEELIRRHRNHYRNPIPPSILGDNEFW